MKKETIIIPNENILNVPIYNKPVEIHHAKNIKDFSDKYQLGLTFENVGLKENEFYGTFWQIALAKLGHPTLTIEDTTIAYLPETISDRQMKWFLDNKEYFIKIRKKFDYQFIDIPTDEDYYELSPNKEVKQFYQILKEKNKLEKEKQNGRFF